MCSKKHIRHKLLFDESLPLPKAFPNLHRLHDIFHLAQSDQRGITDQEVFALAQELVRILVVVNVRDFKPLIHPHKPSIIFLSPGLTWGQIDLKLCRLLKELTPSQEKGKGIFLTPNGVRIETSNP